MNTFDIFLTNNTPYQLLLDDLKQTESVDLLLYPLSYTDEMDIKEKFHSITRAMFRAKRIYNHISFLINAFYLDQFFETLENVTTQVTYIKEITRHYYLASVRIYYLYEVLGTFQIAKSRNLTLNLILRISKSQFNKLVDKALNIFTRMQNLKGE
ncbi:14424_t:CDS:1 [Funneliformis mosseae]|uniref:14424_t:CDS:1 n=1 Tax=Funneliformis mosseae TaxID=27381 RepID=A0A9N9I104_FUNMO|nr:14424_t:CDS:1 [Funneliformis mosseae]